MSSRALRKAQREREEQERLEKLEREADEESEGDVEPAQPAKKGAFAFLERLESVEAEVEGDAGVAVEPEDTEDERPEPTQPSIPKPSAKKKKKKKNKTKTSGGTPTQQKAEEKEQVDEIDQALKQLSTQGDPSLPATTTVGKDGSTEELCRLLAVETTHLHASNEMRRLFGRAAVERQEEEDRPPAGNVGGNRRQQRRVQQVGLAQALRGQGGHGGRGGGLAAIALRKNIFIQGKEEWPVATGGGLGMEIEEKRADGPVLYKFVHNRIYQDVQAQFQIAVESMDPNRLVVLLQHNPYHISTLLQVSEIAKQEGDHTTSGDLLERSLFSFGRAVHSTFAKNLSEGKARLDFRRAENREFWLAAWRYMQNLSMRATWRTVYEWAKLLLSLSPEEDAYAVWLVLDQYALRARQDLDFLNLSRNVDMKGVHEDMPNVQLSGGLAEIRAGNKVKGKQALFTAIRLFPWVVARLMQELQLDPPPGIWGTEPRTEREKLYSELYATRAKDLWNTPENSALLAEVASALPPDMKSAPVEFEGVQRNEARHVLLSDTPTLIALVPRMYTSALTSTSDLLPPADSYPSYLPAKLARDSSGPERDTSNADTNNDLEELHGLYGFFSSLLPWIRRDRAEGPLEDGAEPTEDELERRIQESGIDEETFTEGMRRMVELRERIAPELGDHMEGEALGRELYTLSRHVGLPTRNTTATTTTTNTGSTADDLRELHSLFEFFSNLYPWLVPGGDPADEPPQEEIIRQGRATGLDEEAFTARSERMRELHGRLRELVGDALDAGAVARVLDGMGEPVRMDEVPGGGGGGLGARVEDGEEDGG